MPPGSNHPAVVTISTLALGAIGAALGYALSFPVFILTGPAILITLLSLCGLRLTIHPVVRDGALLMIGIAIGAGVDARAAAAVLRWPLAFLLLALMLVGLMLASRWLLVRRFGYGHRAAVLAATPGHLSYVLTLGASLNVNMAQISVVQAVRLFAMTMLVPFVALAFGLKVSGFAVQSASPMTLGLVLILTVLGLLSGLVLRRFNVPAPLLLGGLIISTLAHVSDLAPGPLGNMFAMPAFLVIGTMIGSRFSGITFAMLRTSLMAGLATTLIAVIFAVAAALPAAWLLQIPLAHVLVAFAPGGLETMIAMGAVLGANPGFVAAAHVARLLFLTVLVPVLLPAAQRADTSRSDAL